MGAGKDSHSNERRDDLLSITYFNESPPVDLALKDMVVFIEPDNHFNLLKTVPIADQHLSAGIPGFTSGGKIQAGFVAEINLPPDGFATTLAPNREKIICSTTLRREKEFFKEVHGVHQYEKKTPVYLAVRDCGRGIEKMPNHCRIIDG